MAAGTQGFSVELSDYTEEHIGLDRRTGDEIRTPMPADRDPKGSRVGLDRLLVLAKEMGATIEHSASRYDHHGMRHYDFGITWHEVESVLTLFGTGGAGWLFLKQCQPILLQWLKNKESRRVKVKLHGFEVEIHGEKDIKKVLSLLKEALPQAAPEPVVKASLKKTSQKAKTRPKTPLKAKVPRAPRKK